MEKEKQTIKAYETTYALTEGVVVHPEAKVLPDFKGMLEVPISGKGWSSTRYLHGEGKNWHRTWEGAIKKAEAMRQKKISSLKKALKKMEALSFPSSEPAQ